MAINFSDNKLLKVNTVNNSKSCFKEKNSNNAIISPRTRLEIVSPRVQITKSGNISNGNSSNNSNNVNISRQSNNSISSYKQTSPSKSPSKTIQFNYEATSKNMPTIHNSRTDITTDSISSRKRIKTIESKNSAQSCEDNLLSLHESITSSFTLMTNTTIMENNENNNNDNKQPTFLHFDLKLNHECTNKIINIVENIKEVLNLTLKDHIDSDFDFIKPKDNFDIQNLSSSSLRIGSELNFLSKMNNLTTSQNKEKILLDKKLKMNLVAQEIEIVNNKAEKFNAIMNKLYNKEECKRNLFRTKPSENINNIDLNVSNLALFFNKSNLSQKIKKIEIDSDKRIDIYNNMFSECKTNFQEISDFILGSVKKQEQEELDKELNMEMSLKRKSKMENVIYKKLALCDRLASINQTSNMNNFNSSIKKDKPSNPFGRPSKLNQILCEDEEDYISDDEYRESVTNEKISTAKIFIPSSHIGQVHKDKELNLDYKVLRKQFMIYNDKGLLEPINDSFEQKIFKYVKFKDENIKKIRKSINNNELENQEHRFSKKRPKSNDNLDNTELHDDYNYTTVRTRYILYIKIVI